MVCVCVCVCVKVFGFWFGFGFLCAEFITYGSLLGFAFGFAYLMTESHTVFTLRFLQFTVGVYFLCLFIIVFFGGDRM